MSHSASDNDISTHTDAIAIVGMACRLPGGNSTPEAYWDFLLNKGNGISEVPKDRWDADSFYNENPDSISTAVTKWAGFLDDIRGFDAQFFGISPREAASMDPQQRLLLQCTYEAMQDTRIPAKEFSNVKTGVFVGISQSDYRTLQEMRPTNPESFAGTGYALCINANRISHRLNLSGPSVAVDTACSSSLVALNQGIQNLRSGACDVAAVAGVNILAHPTSFIAFSRAGMLSNTGQISTFDESANGFVRGEAVGVVILKPYKKALADGDRIHALVHASVCNQDGFTSTITAPSQDAQIEMLEALFEKSGIPKNKIGYVEAHGTGTPVGDPIEAGAIGTVIGQHNDHRPVYVGSGKANIGHGESAAGICGLIKATLAVKHGVVPPNVNYSKPNPYIPFDALNLRVPTKPEPFPEENGTRYAVVNSFGFGGTNASALISSAPETTTKPARADQDTSFEGFPLFFPLSGPTEEALIANAQELQSQLRGKKSRLADVALHDLSAALACERSHLSHRTVILARSRAELIKSLKSIIKNDPEVTEKETNIVSGQANTGLKLCFMFSGQGSQWWAMARDFLEHNRTFRKAVENYDTHFVKAAGWSILEELLRDEATSRIDDTTVTQPALFAIQSGLAAVWAKFGVKPDMVVGHSIGEAAASYVSGGLSLSGAASFLSKRGAIRDQLGAKGAMAAIGMGPEDVKETLPDHGLIGIAAVNGPGSTTISGDYDAIHKFVEDFQYDHPDTFIRLLKVDTAWHSYQLEAGEDWFRREVAQIDWSVPRLPFISTVTGNLETRFDTDYGWLNLRRPVMFRDGIETALDLGATTFVELGPHATLAGPTTSTALEKGARVQVMSSLSRKEGDFDVLARTAANLFVQGHDLDWQSITGGATHTVNLPLNRWMEEPLWQDSEESRKQLNTPWSHPFLGMPTTHATKSWMMEINTKAWPFLKDHRMENDTLFPGAGHVEMMIALGREVHGDKPIEIQNAIIHEALFIPDDKDLLLSSAFSKEQRKIEIFSRFRDVRDDWVLRSECKLRVTDVPAPKVAKFDADHTTLRDTDLSLVYDVDASQSFVNYGECFQVIEKLWLGRNKSVAKMRAPKGIAGQTNIFFAHPALLDGCLQISDPRMDVGKIDKERKPGDPVYLPVGARRIRFYAPFPDEIMVHAQRYLNAETQEVEANFSVTNMDGDVLMRADGLMMRSLATGETVQDDEAIKPNFVEQSYTELRDAAQIEVAPETLGRWIVLARGKSKLKHLLREMKAQGADVSVLDRDDLGHDLISGIEDQFGEDLQEGKIAGILYAGALAHAGVADDIDPDALYQRIEPDTMDLIALGDMMDFHRTDENGLARICVLTSGATPDPETGVAASSVLTQAPIYATARVLASETPEYTVRIFDADSLDKSTCTTLVQRMFSTSAETETIIRSGTCWGVRLLPRERDEFAPRLLDVTEKDHDINFHATMHTPGVIDDLGLWEIPMMDMGDDDVQVRIVAVGLNFRDVMAITGLLPEEAEPDPAWQHLGLEFGGVIHAVGKNVKDFKPGDRVMGMERRCLQRFMTIDPRALTILPEHISLEEAATIPSAFATAHYALNHVGRMQEGEKVFIHVATGGVGMAAVQLAQDVGTEIFATAGSPKKRKILKDLGVHHVMDSRSLKFADDVDNITKGAGVDVLLNSLPGEYISKGLDIVAPYGRYLEIGKVDVYNDSPIGMKALRKNISFSVLDLAAMGQERPELLGKLLSQLVVKFNERKLQPLPLTAFPISKIADAVRYMSQARHIGKVVVTLDEETFKVRRDTNRPVTLSANASYLITGGTRGFGLTIADWMSRAGAGHIYLTSRSGTIAKEDTTKVAAMNARGTKITAMSLDVTSQKDMNAFINKATNDNNHPLRGVVHGAAVIKDGFVNQLTPDMITDVLRPKVLGGWTLHKAFEAAGVEPEFLIGFSSIAQMIGSGGQANYASANAFLDALALYRRSIGREGTAIDWGAMAESGFVARSDGLANYLESVGLHGLSDTETDAGMEVALSRDIGSFIYSKAEWPQIARANTALGQSPRMGPLLHSEGGGGHEIRARLMSLSGEELRQEAEEFLKDEVVNVLKIDKSVIQSDRPMSELGLDSLSSFELKMRVETALDLSLPVSRFLQAPSISEFAVLLEEEMNALAEAEAKAAAQESSSTAEDADINTETEEIILGSDWQFGVLKQSLAPMTSSQGQQSMQHVASVTLPDAPDAKDVQKAIGKLCRRHPVLRLRFDEVQGSGKIHFDAPNPAMIQGPLPDMMRVAQGQLVQIALDGTTLAVRIHATVGDGTSARILVDELQTVLAGGTLAKACSKAAIKRALHDMRFDPETPKGQNDRAFWWYSIRHGAPVVPFDRRSRALLPFDMGRNRGAAASQEWAFDSTEDQASLLMRFAQSLREVTQSAGNVIVNRMISTRDQQSISTAIGPFVCDQPVLIETATDPTLALTKLRRTLAHGADHTSFGTTSAGQEFAADVQNWDGHLFQIGVGTLSKDAPLMATCDLLLEIGKDKVRLIWDTDAVDTATAQKVGDTLTRQKASLGQ